MKLELKYLAPYLPYGLKGEVNNHEYNEKHIDELDTISFFDKVLTFRNEACDVYLENNEFGIFKPILRPLSDLTKDEFKNKIFKLQKHYNDVTLLFAYNFYYELSVWEYEFLVSNHFDVFRLIPRGLAIDINTLNK